MFETVDYKLLDFKDEILSYFGWTQRGFSGCVWLPPSGRSIDGCAKARALNVVLDDLGYSDRIKNGLLKDDALNEIHSKINIQKVMNCRTCGSFVRPGSEMIDVLDVNLQLRTALNEIKKIAETKYSKKQKIIDIINTTNRNMGE